MYLTIDDQVLIIRALRRRLDFVRWNPPTNKFGQNLARAEVSDLETLIIRFEAKLKTECDTLDAENNGGQ